MWSEKELGKKKKKKSYGVSSGTSCRYMFENDDERYTSYNYYWYLHLKEFFNREWVTSVTGNGLPHTGRHHITATARTISFDTIFWSGVV